MSYADQVALEREMASAGKARADKRTRLAKEKKRESRTVAGKRLLQDLPAILIAAIEKQLLRLDGPGPKHRALSKMKDLDPRLMAVVTLQTVLDSLSETRSFTAVAMAISARLEDEERYQSFIAQSPMKFAAAVERSQDYTAYSRKRRHILWAMSHHGLEVPSWELDVRGAVGFMLLDLCERETGLIEIQTVRSHGKAEQRIAPTAETLEWVEDVNQHGSLLAPLLLPFVVEPLDWVDVLSGGYHSTEIRQSALIKTYDRPYIRKIKDHKYPEVFETINTLQRVAWRVNPAVWEVFSYLWESGFPAKGLPRRDNDPIPAKPADVAENVEARKAWKKEARAVHDKNNRHLSGRIFTGKLYWTANRYKDLDFWFCWQLDWRGRAYPLSYYLHPQGGDIVKGLLQFRDGKPVTTPEAKLWHSIHGANCFGVDKLPYDERIQWVQDHHEQIMRVYQDPLDCRWWEEADNPWQFLAWCMDYGAMQDDPNHVSHLVIHQDASQSGIQIYSMLLRDDIGAKATNCSPSERPQDLYGRVAAVLIEALKADPNPMAEEWLRFGIDRSTCKRPVMTRVYNATRHSAHQYIEDWAKEKSYRTNIQYPSSTEDTSSIGFLTGHLWNAMKKVISSTSAAQDWLTSVARIFAKKNKRIEWETPVGFPVSQWYPKWQRKIFKTSLGDRYHMRLMYLKAPIDNEVNGRRMVSAFAPNVIHSLDAAAMMKTINLCREAGITNLSAVHDSYGSLAADAPELARLTREAYVQLFGKDLLAELKAKWEADLGEPLPALPAYGTFDVRSVRDSLYFFS